MRLRSESIGRLRRSVSVHPVAVRNNRAVCSDCRRPFAKVVFRRFGHSEEIDFRTPTLAIPEILTENVPEKPFPSSLLWQYIEVTGPVESNQVIFHRAVTFSKARHSLVEPSCAGVEARRIGY